MDLGMPALGRTDRVGTADVFRTRRQRVVRTLAVLRPDRMDRWEIQDVEPHPLDAGQMADDVAERAMPRRIIAHRAREHLIPACEPGRGAFGLDRDRLLQLDEERTVVGRVHQCGHLGQQQRLALRVLGLAPLQQGPQRGGELAALGPRGRRFDQGHAFLDFKRCVHAGLVLGAQLEHVIGPDVFPGLDRVLRQSEPLERQVGRPAIVDDEAHRHFRPGRLAGAAVFQRGSQPVVPIANQVARDRHDRADRSARREAPAVDCRARRLDGDARSLGGLRRADLRKRPSRRQRDRACGEAGGCPRVEVERCRGQDFTRGPGEFAEIPAQSRQQVRAGNGHPVVRHVDDDEPGTVRPTWIGLIESLERDDRLPGGGDQS